MPLAPAARTVPVSCGRPFRVAPAPLTWCRRVVGVALACCYGRVTVGLRRSYGGATVELRWDIGVFGLGASGLDAPCPGFPSSMPLHWTDAAAIHIGSEEAGDSVVHIRQDYPQGGAQSGVLKQGGFV